MMAGSKTEFNRKKRKKESEGKKKAQNPGNSEEVHRVLTQIRAKHRDLGGRFLKNKTHNQIVINKRNRGCTYFNRT